ncbi:MAG: heavy-metal-associated domain-containing protein [Desulfovibrio sp.]|jgi:Cu2+-exporting ATPase/Cu+-exporting ATPase|nr:heavy-metal-associated domain-containing protein [Desulfovibrio sp.]
MKKSIRIEGMNCGHCTGSVEKALRSIPGLADVNVDLASKTAIVEVKTSVSDDALKIAVTDTGFTVVGIQKETSL